MDLQIAGVAPENITMALTLKTSWNQSSNHV